MTILNQYAYIAEALGWAVLHSVWQVSLAAILVWITSLPVFRLSARARYWVALSTITMALIGFVATFIHYSGHDIQQASGDGLLIGRRGEMAGETGIGLSAAANTARNPLEFLTSHAGIIGLAWGVFIAGAVQLFFQFPFLLKLAVLPRPRWEYEHEGV